MNYLLASLLGLSLVLIQCLIGGTRLIFAFPAYALIGFTPVAALFFIRKASPKPLTLCVVSAVAMAAYVLVRAWTSPVPYLARTDAYMVAACLLVYLVTVYYLHSSKARMWVVYALVGMALVHVLVGVAQFRYHNGYMLLGFWRGDDSYRASGQLICPNHLAGYLEAVGLMLLALTVWSRINVALKLLTAYLSIVCFLGVVITCSRGGYLSTAVGITALALVSLWIVTMYNRQGTLRTAIGVALGIVIFAGSTFYVVKSSKNIHERMSLIGSSSEDIRIYNWLATLDQFKEAPVLGTGAGTHLWYGRLFRRPELQPDPIHSHSDYLETLAEYGLVGEALALTFLGLHLYYGLRTVRAVTMRRLCNSLTTNRSDSLGLTVGALCGILAIAAHSVVDFNMHIPGNALLMAFFFGILANPGLARTEKETPWFGSLTLIRGGMALGGVALILAVGWRFQGEYWTEKARIALRDQHYRESQEYGQKALAADPSNPFTYFHLGEAYRVPATLITLPALRAPMFEKAVNAYHQSLAIFPHDENALIRLGQAFDGLHQFDAARKAYQAALQLDPNLGIVHAYYSAHLRLAGNTAEADAALARSRQLGTVGAEKMGARESQIARQFLTAQGAIEESNTP